MENNYCIIMAGGAGVRFWPQSRTDRPKQFIDILGSGQTLLQQTVNRVLPVCSFDNIFVVTNDIYKDLVKQQLPQMKDDRILCEPCRRNTAPCIAYATYKIFKENHDANILVTPADHVITNEPLFADIVSTGIDFAKNSGNLVTLGIKPTRPETGYGYIKFNNKTIQGQDVRIRKSISFTEKPDLAKAKEFINEGCYLWNAGIFIWNVNSALDAFEKYLPQVDNIFKEGLNVYNTAGEKSYIDKVYPECPNISIDYGVMEKADNVFVIISDFGWSDVGTWGSLYSIKQKDDQSNVLFSDDILVRNTEKCLIKAPEGKIVSVNGLDGFIVVWDGDALMICKMENEQQIREMVDDIKDKKGNKFI